ncbi:MAG TPA: hypothetical protein EYH54_06025, partial [Nautiliaceae bacterium]|nr:hypothetical protein [Nautiliaceae bacterium]
MFNKGLRSFYFFFLLIINIILSSTLLSSYTGEEGYFEYELETLGFSGSWIYKKFLDEGLSLTVLLKSSLTDKTEELNFCGGKDYNLLNFNVNANINCSNAFTYSYSGNDPNIFFDIVLEETDVKCDFKINITMNYKESTDEGTCKDASINDYLEGSFTLLENVAVLDKEPAKEWDFIAKWERCDENTRTCDLNVYLRDNEILFFETEPGNTISFSLDINLEDYEGFSFDRIEGSLKYNDFTIEKVDPNSIRMECDLNDAYGSMSTCPYSVEKENSLTYDVLIGKCRPDWLLTKASDDDYFEISCNIELEVVAYDHNKREIAREKYTIPLDEVTVNVTGIPGAKPLMDLIDEAITNMTSSLRMSSVFYLTTHAYQTTASGLLIAFGELASMSLECPPIDLTVIQRSGSNEGETINTALENVLFFSKVTWCQLGNMLLNGIKTYLFYEMLEKLKKGEPEIVINNQTVKFTKLSHWIKENIEKMIGIVGLQASLCTMAAYKLASGDREVRIITGDEGEEGVLLKLTRAICGPYYQKVKDLIKLKAQCKEDNELKTMSEICKSKINDIVLFEGFKSGNLKSLFGNVSYKCGSTYERLLSLGIIEKNGNKLMLKAEKLCSENSIEQDIITDFYECVKQIDKQMKGRELRDIIIGEEKGKRKFMQCLLRNNFDENFIDVCLIQSIDSLKEEIKSELSSFKAPTKVSCSYDKGNINCELGGEQDVEFSNKFRINNDSSFSILSEPIEIEIDVEKVIQVLEGKGEGKLLISCEDLKGAIGRESIKEASFLPFFRDEYYVEVLCNSNNNKKIILLKPEDFGTSRCEINFDNINYKEGKLILNVTEVSCSLEVSGATFMSDLDRLK